MKVTENALIVKKTPQEKTCSQSTYKTWLILGSTILGAGVGLAMMPIFNREVKNLENYGINVHESNTSFAISTINTLIIAGCSTGFYLYNYFINYQEKTKQEEPNKAKTCVLTLCKIGSVVSALIPVSMLWNVELDNQKVEGTHGFDQFVAWAAFTSVPLLIFKTSYTYNKVSKYVIAKFDNSNNTNGQEISSLGGKLIVYGISGISLIGRGIALTHIFDQLMEKFNIEENISLPVSIVTGGILGNLIFALNEYSSLKKLFINNDCNITKTQLTTGLVSAFEGSWFALPFISQGMEATKEWNSFLKGALFSSVFCSKAATESTRIYRSIFPECNEEPNNLTLSTPILTEEVLENNEVNLSGETHSENLESA